MNQWIGVLGCVNKIFRDKGRTGYNKQFFNNLKGGLDITLDKRKFDDAFDKLKQRYESKPLYNPWDNSNDFIINLFHIFFSLPVSSQKIPYRF